MYGYYQVRSTLMMAYVNGTMKGVSDTWRLEQALNSLLKPQYMTSPKCSKIKERIATILV